MFDRLICRERESRQSQLILTLRIGRQTVKEGIVKDPRKDILQLVSDQRSGAR